jgi:hypothetical protein
VIANAAILRNMKLNVLMRRDIMKLTHVVAAACLAALIGSGAALAQTPAAGAKSTTAAAPKARTAKSLACSKEADEKNIHGKARKKFMSTCKKA